MVGCRSRIAGWPGAARRAKPDPGLLALLLLLAGLSAPAATILEAPEETSHRTRLMLDIKASRWELQGKCFNGMVEAHNQASRDARLHVVVSGEGSYRKSVVVPAGQSVRFPVYIPIFNSSANGWRGYTVNFRQDGDSAVYPWGSFNDYSYSHRDMPVLRPRNTADLPTESRLCWPFTTVSLAPAQWTGLAPARREAILSWVELGGHLHFNGGNHQDTAAAFAARPSNKFLGPGNYGAGSISAGPEPDKGSAGLTCLGADMKLSPSWQVAKLSPWKFIPLVVIFAVLVGPGTIWFCHWRRRPALALAVIPGVSLGACLVILAFSLLSDGASPKVCRQTLTLLDQREGIAVTGQIIGIEAPLGVFGPVVFPEEAMVLLPGVEGISPQTAATGGQLQVRGAVLARTPTFFAMLHHERRRERLDLRRDGDVLRVVNGLGAPIERLALREANGTLWYSSATIPPGAEAALGRWVPKTMPSGLTPPGSFSALGLCRLRESDTMPPPGCYQARLGARAFGVPGIVGGRSVGDGFDLVAGQFEEKN